MPRKIKDVTKDYLVNVALPVHGQTYTVISHQSIIDYAYAELANQGFGIINEEYRSTLDGQIAQGIYRLQYGTDPEMNVMFAWTNSYNKQIRFKCATGGYVNANQTVMLAGQLGNYARKHTGTADADVIASMQAQITDATMYYNQLVSDKEVMKTIALTSRRQAELLGVLFAEYEILTTEQASIIRQQMDKPSYFYNGGKDTLWAFYNHCTVALQQSHPRSWMEDQRMLHWVISNEFTLTPPLVVESEVEAVVDPLLTNYGQPENQTNLLIQLAEETGDTELLDVLKVQHPVAESDAFIGMEEDEELMREAFMEDLEAGEYKGDIIAEEIVQYTDPVGNTFEAPVVTMDVVDLNETTKMAVIVSEEPELTLDEPRIDISDLEGEYSLDEVDQVIETIEERIEEAKVEPQVAPERVKFAIDDDFDLSLDFNDENSDDDLFL